MEFRISTHNVIGYSNHEQANLIVYIKRVICLLSCAIVIPFTLWHIVYEANTFIEKIRPLLALFFGSSSLITYAVMLLQRGSILDLLAKLQLELNKRMFNQDFVYFSEALCSLLSLAIWWFLYGWFLYGWLNGVVENLCGRTQSFYCGKIEFHANLDKSPRCVSKQSNFCNP